MRTNSLETEKGKKMEEKAVIVTTKHRAVFFGYTASRTMLKGIDTIRLDRARNCIYWPRESHGFLGLAAVGPLEGARVGPAADIILSGITCVAVCSPAAVELWESEPWED